MIKPANLLYYLNHIEVLVLSYLSGGINPIFKGFMPLVINQIVINNIELEVFIMHYKQVANHNS